MLIGCPDSHPQERGRLVDCFFVHPTTYFGKGWNAPVPHAPADEQVDLVMATQASAFNATCVSGRANLAPR